MRRHRQDLMPQADLNITNMLDVAFVLLIVFMIVAPSLKTGLDIKLPTVTEAKAIDVKDQPTVVEIRNRTDKEDLPNVFLDEKRVDYDELKKQLLVKAERNHDLAVLVRCDKNEQSDVLLHVVGSIQGAGIENVSLETQAK
jgi:biopolymer transport protein TolR